MSNGDGDDNALFRKSAVQIGAQILVALAVGMGSAYLTATSSMARMDERLNSTEKEVTNLKEKLDEMENEYYKTQRQNRNRLIRLEMTLYQLAQKNGVDVPNMSGRSSGSGGGVRMRMPKSFPKSMGSGAPKPNMAPRNNANNSGSN